MDVILLVLYVLKAREDALDTLIVERVLVLGALALRADLLHLIGKHLKVFLQTRHLLALHLALLGLLGREDLREAVNGFSVV